MEKDIWQEFARLYISQDEYFRDQTDNIISYISDLQKYKTQMPIHEDSRINLINKNIIPNNAPLFQEYQALADIIDTINSEILIHIWEQKPVEQEAPRTIKQIDFNYPSDTSGCICVISQSPQMMQNSKTSYCFNCRKSFHLDCVRFRPKNKLFVCPICVLYSLDPLHKIEQCFSLKQFTPRRGNQSLMISFTINRPIQYLEIRCINLDSQRPEQSWPDVGELRLNNQIVQKFSPLQNNSSIKYRKDEKFTIQFKQLGQNSIQIQQIAVQDQAKSKQYRIRSDDSFFIGIFAIQKLQPEVLIQQITQQPSSYVSIEQMKDNIYSSNSKTGQVEISDFSISLICQISFESIITPVRGILCEHIQCFSLEQYLGLQFKNKIRTFECIICKKPIIQFQIDSYIQQIIKHIKASQMNIQNIKFNSSGQVVQFKVPKIYQNPEEFNQRNYFQEIIQLKQKPSESFIILEEDNIKKQKPDSHSVPRLRK